jgi:RimJ/RimL family protein N-acetyltransferase
MNQPAPLIAEPDGWPRSDGLVVLHPPRPGDAAILIAGRDEAWERWLGPENPDPCPTACILVRHEIVGWVDYDTDQGWLGPDDVNIGYNIFGPHRRKGYATGAVRLLLRFLQEHTQATRAYLVIHPDNAASLGVARSVGASPVDPVTDLSGRPNLWHVVEL